MRRASVSGSSEESSERQIALYVDGALEMSANDLYDEETEDVPKTPEAFGVQIVSSCDSGMCEEGMQIGGLYCCGGEGYSGK